MEIAKPVKRKKPSVQDFNITDVLGEGSYARVYLATHRKSGKKFAAKVINIKQISRLGKQNTVMTERKCLAESRHPNIVKLHYTFRDKESLYFILELIPGGELFDLIERLGPLGTELSRFYAAEIFDVVHYLHKKGILHRDLKPENVLVTKDRHLKVTDFGTAGFYEEKKVNGTTVTSERRSCVGTAEYVAPEVLEGSGQTGACDIWSVGCILYHMIVGKPPFKGKSEWLTFQEVKKCTPKFENDFPDTAKDLLKKIFRLKPVDRIQPEQIKVHKFFMKISWKDLAKKIPPPWPKPVESMSMGGLLSTRHCVVPDDNSEPVDMRTSNEFLSVPTPRVGKGQQDEEAKTKESISQLKLDINTLNKFLEKGEKVVYAGFIIKRSFSGMGFLPRKRELVLTSLPRFLYFDPKKSVLKGIIPWSKGLFVEAKTRNTFVIFSKKKKYTIKCLGHETTQWVKAIQSCK